MRLKRFLTLAGLALACTVVGMGWSSDLAIQGHDIITADGGGADVFAAGKGEDLLCGDMPDHYPWPTSAVTIAIRVDAAADTGWVLVDGLTATGAERLDSVWATGTGTYALSGTWWRVNAARFKDDSPNAGIIRVYRGIFGYVYPDSILATIMPRQSRSCQDHYTVPAGKKQVIPKSWRVTPVAVSGHPDSLAVGTAAVVGREYGGNWGLLDHLQWSTATGAVNHPYPPTQWDLGPLADMVIPAASTGAETIIDSRLQFETR